MEKLNMVGIITQTFTKTLRLPPLFGPPWLLDPVANREVNGLELQLRGLKTLQKTKNGSLHLKYSVSYHINYSSITYEYNKHHSIVIILSNSHSNTGARKAPMFEVSSI